MSSLFLLLLFFRLFASISSISQTNQNDQQRMDPPKAKKIPYQFELFNTTIEDEFCWLRAKEWPSKVTDTAILSYLAEENAYFDNFMLPLEKEKELLFEELKGRIELSSQSENIRIDDYLYYTRTQEDKDYGIYCRKQVMVNDCNSKGEEAKSDEEEIILDVNQLAIGHSYTRVGDLTTSPNQNLLAYTIDLTGEETYKIKVLDLGAKKYLEDEIDGVLNSVYWHEQLNGFFYTPVDEFWRTNTLMFHLLGTKQEEDKLVHQINDTLYSIHITKSASKEFVFIFVYGYESNEVLYLSTTASDFAVNMIREKKDGVLYSIDHNSDFLYMVTNENAKNYQLLRAKITSPDDLEWEVYLEEDKDRYLDDVSLTKNFLLINYKQKGLPILMVQELNDKTTKTISFPDAVYQANVYTTNYEDDDIRISYSSLARPATIYSYNFHTNKLTVLKEQVIPSGFDPNEYNVERIYAETGDNVQVPITLFYKKELFRRDGLMPVFLNGYGSYGASESQPFRTDLITWANKGFLFAYAHVRGSGYLGREWYEAAKFLTKKRTFEDFIAVADTLIEQNYTTTGNIVILGGSAGGLLIGAVINERPELFKVAVAHVPFVDVLNTMLDETLPLTPSEFKEWGNPKEEPFFHYIQSYSPYDNVRQQNYPALFVTAGLSDPRVGYWEPAKFVARLKDRKTDNNTILLKTNMEYGHFGASGRFDYLKQRAEVLAFVFKVFGL